MAAVNVKKPRCTYRKQDKKTVSEDTKTILNYILDPVTEQQRKRGSTEKSLDNVEIKRKKTDEKDPQDDRSYTATDLTSPTSETKINWLNIQNRFHDDDDEETLDSIDGQLFSSHRLPDKPGADDGHSVDKVDVGGSDDDDDADGDGSDIPRNQLTRKEKEKKKVLKKIANNLIIVGDGIDAKAGGKKIDPNVLSAFAQSLVCDLTYEKFKETMIECVGAESDVKNLIVMFQLTQCVAKAAADSSIVTKVKTLASTYFDEHFAEWLGESGGYDCVADVITE